MNVIFFSMKFHWTQPCLTGTSLVLYSARTKTCIFWVSLFIIKAYVFSLCFFFLTYHVTITMTLSLFTKVFHLSTSCKKYIVKFSFISAHDWPFFSNIFNYLHLRIRTYPDNRHNFTSLSQLLIFWVATQCYERLFYTYMCFNFVRLWNLQFATIMRHATITVTLHHRLFKTNWSTQWARRFGIYHVLLHKYIILHNLFVVLFSALYSVRHLGPHAWMLNRSTTSLDFPKRCALECIKHTEVSSCVQSFCSL